VDDEKHEDEDLPYCEDDEDEEDKGYYKGGTLVLCGTILRHAFRNVANVGVYFIPSWS